MAVSDDEILDAQRLLASSDGLFAEPASCAPLAGLLKLKREGELPSGLRIVLVLTGNGLKDPDSATSRVPLPVEIDGTREALMEVLSS